MSDGSGSWWREEATLVEFIDQLNLLHRADESVGGVDSRRCCRRDANPRESGIAAVEEAGDGRRSVRNRGTVAPCEQRRAIRALVAAKKACMSEWRPDELNFDALPHVRYHALDGVPQPLRTLLLELSILGAPSLYPFPRFPWPFAA